MLCDQSSNLRPGLEVQLLRHQTTPKRTSTRSISGTSALRAVTWIAGSIFCLAWLGGPIWAVPEIDPPSLPVPWRAAGLDEWQAAAHLLSRLTYGSRPGEVQEVVTLGIDNWIERQLSGDSPGGEVAAELARYEALSLTPQTVARQYPHHSRVVAEAIAEGTFSREAFEGELGEKQKMAAQASLESFAERLGYHPIGEVVAQLRAQKIYRALLSQAQLREILVDLWFNHFNVTIQDTDSRRHVLAYEQEAIRPHVLGSFRELLGATARHPAMLLYLGNAQSAADQTRETTFDLAMGSLGDFSPLGDRGRRKRLAKFLGWRPLDDRLELLRGQSRPRGLNENYARELLELHTVGVGGGYSQQDVIEVARAFTGWTTLPQRRPDPDLRQALRIAEKEDLGFVVDGQFLFRPDRHDSEPKKILGTAFPAGQGIEDGEQVLDLLARHPATARRVATKLASRFVADDPPPELVERLAETFLLSGGDLREVMRTLLRSPEFWLEAREPRKLKTPLELAISALRGLDAKVERPGSLIEWLQLAGQPLYAYAAPTGYPDRLETWANVGSTLSRINFGLGIAKGRLPGIRVDMESILGSEELETYTGAVEYFLPMLLPERNLSDQLWRLAGLADLSADALDEDTSDRSDQDETPVAGIHPATASGSPGPAADEARQQAQRRTQKRALYAISLLIASPEFQYR